MKQLPFAILLTLLSPWVAAQQAEPVLLSEKDFLDDMPVVLSVSRLAQPLDEAPGAVTVLDRAFIRMTGARDVADLLRLVPGFQTTTSFETDAPMASYHGRNDDWANRIQVLVDGRSVYSGHLQGSAGLGLETLAIDDIERIEVLRGSNSASYGARAFLGVINIVSRDARDTSGGRTRLSAGDGGVADVYAAVGWGRQDNAYRLSMDSRGDTGLRGAYGVNRVSRLNFSGAISLAPASSLAIRAGSLGIDAGRGESTSPGNVSRSRFLGSQFFQADFQLPVAVDQDLQISFSQTENTHRDLFPFYDSQRPANYQGVPVDFSAFEVNQALTLQHTASWSPRWRTVWGVELRKEVIDSPSSFDGRGSVTSNFQRLFGNAEWRIQPSLLLNGGLMLEQSELGGGTASPRVMLNWHVLPGHTLRAGVSSAFRPPSAYEKYAAVRYYDANHTLLQTTALSSGNLVPEKIAARELGYNLSLPAYGVAGDLRLFDERISDGIERPFDPKDESPNSPNDYLNIDNYRITGAEHQIQWRPASSALVFLTQTWTHVEGAERFRVTHSAARYAMSLSGQFTTSGGYVWSAMHAQSEDIALMSDKKNLYSVSRTDVRVAKPFLLGRHKADISLTLQNMDKPYRDGDWKFMFDRRAFVTLQVEQ
jgi:iron complex outermembrane receptor protein